MKSKYELIVFWSEDDQCFLVEVPELAGCMADGNSYAEAVANAELVIQKWLETATELGRPIPSVGRRALPPNKRESCASLPSGLTPMMPNTR